MPALLAVLGLIAAMVSGVIVVARAAPPEARDLMTSLTDPTSSAVFAVSSDGWRSDSGRLSAGFDRAGASLPSERWIRQSNALSSVTISRLPPRVAEAIVAAEIAAQSVREHAPTPVPAPQPAPSVILRYAGQRLGASVPPAIRQWSDLITRQAQAHDLDPNLVAAVMQTESGGSRDAVSSANAVGLMQILDGPFDPEQNVAIGAQLLATHLRAFGRVDLALAAYNAGPGNVARYGGVPPFEETRRHILRTLASYSDYTTPA
ncbi:MAG: lytic transglycosylase domain-containing protein [Chloroflexota bacterium]|nr:MAG: lytic transglycosylase domain-containing protein [Chloroflexota bacterium]